MERIKKLNLYQKVILLLLAAMLVAFAIAYSIVTSRVGYAYKKAILIPAAENGNTVYTGRVQGEKTTVTVSPDKEITFSCGENVYGPYTLREDPSALPDEHEWSNHMTGVEILEKDKVFFRGGVMENGGPSSEPLLFDEDGGLHGFTISYMGNDGIERDMDGNPIDELAPSATDILELAKGPKLTSKGDWGMWFLSVFVSIFAAASILYADELFRWSMSFQIRNADRAEPSDWEIAQRYIAWTLFAVMALAGYIAGLTI